MMHFVSRHGVSNLYGITLYGITSWAAPSGVLSGLTHITSGVSGSPFLPKP